MILAANLARVCAENLLLIGIFSRLVGEKITETLKRGVDAAKSRASVHV